MCRCGDVLFHIRKNNIGTKPLDDLERNPRILLLIGTVDMEILESYTSCAYIDNALERKI